MIVIDWNSYVTRFLIWDKNLRKPKSLIASNLESSLCPRIERAMSGTPNELTRSLGWLQMIISYVTLCLWFSRREKCFSYSILGLLEIVPLSIKSNVISLLTWIEATYMLSGGDWMLVSSKFLVMRLHLLVVWWSLRLGNLRYLIRSMLVDIKSPRQGVLCFNLTFFLTDILLSYS